ncbi:MAG: transcriptional regulator [Sphingomonadales bacterium]|nr:MAG: transcriptional regulator [Sphingomonadales bacterium]
MQLKEVTKSFNSPRSRWYDDACGTALALELVGERWSLLIVRELMFGGRRFGELKANLLGISANILTQRLEGLEASKIVAKRKLPPPASVQIYELTPWGYESERAIQELGRWAVRSHDHDVTLPLSAASMMMSFRTMYASARAPELIGRTICFEMGAEHFVAVLEPEQIAIRRGDAPADARFESDPMTLASIIYGGRPFADAENMGALTVSGDRALAERFPALFVLPDKI